VFFARNASKSPSDPTPHVLPKPGGGQRLPRLLLVEPDRTFDEVLDGQRVSATSRLSPTRRAKIDGQQMTAFDVVDDSSTGIAMCYIARVRGGD